MIWKGFRAGRRKAAAGGVEVRDQERPVALRSPRRPLRMPVRFFEPGKEAAVHLGYTVDISATGVFIVTSSRLPCGTRIIIRPVSETCSVEVEAEVARHANWPSEVPRGEEGGIGVRFADPDGVEARSFSQEWEQLTTRRFQSGRHAV